MTAIRMRLTKPFRYGISVCGLTLAVLLSSAPQFETASAHSYKIGKIAIGHFWAPPTAPGASGAAVYGPLFNRGTEAAQLIGASSPLADRVRFRIDAGGRTEWPETVQLVPGKPLAMAPWRVHLWLERLHTPLAAGTHIPLTLDFGGIGQKTIEVIVERSASD